MSNKEEKVVENTDLGGQETAQGQSIDDKIEQAMAKIIADTVESKETEDPEDVRQKESTEVQSEAEQAEAAQPFSENSQSAPENPKKEYGTEQRTASEPVAAMNVKPMPKGQPARGKAKPARPLPKGQPSRNRQQYGNPAYYGEEPVSRKKGIGSKIAKAFGIVAAMVLVILGCAYGVMTYYYSNRFFEGTTINGIDCSGLTVAEVEEQIADKVENYSIEVLSRDLEPQVINGADIDYEYIPDGSVGEALDEQNPFNWISGYFGETEVTASTNISFSQEKLEEQLNNLECAKEENQVAPEDAYVAFQDTEFVIVPETEGRTLDTEKALELLIEAVSESRDQVDFNEGGAYAEASVKSDDPGLASTLEACNAYTKASITYTFGEETRVLDGTTIKDWLTFDENGHLVQDDASFSAHVTEYVAQLAEEYDTVGKERNFHTTTGRDIVVGGGNYGWQIDQSAEAAQLLSEITSGQTVTREPVYSVRGLTPGKDDIGSTYIEVDLTSQHMWYYQDGTVIFESDFVSGDMRYSDRMTPSGVCHLYYKQRDQVLRGDKKEDGTYEYEQPVSYWMPFNGGVGFHDANWRSSFGGDIYMTNGSHGCINMPPENAATLYELINTEVPIVVFY